jgi:Plavaka transposase
MSRIFKRYDGHSIILYTTVDVWQLPDSFKDFVGAHTQGKGVGRECATHCHRELFQTQWRILLDPEFLEAYKHGIVINCCDGVKRRFYPRIFTYSADYPEKLVVDHYLGDIATNKSQSSRRDHSADGGLSLPTMSSADGTTPQSRDES